MKRTIQSRSRDAGFLVVMAALVILDRVFLLDSFGFAYVGSDDPILWQGAVDYTRGIFHEPYFYGQNYNVMLEALFATPLVGSGMSPHQALPLSTTVIGLLPYIVFATTLFRRGKAWGAFIFMLMPLLLPVEYGMLTMMPRGFVNGLFFTGALIFPILDPRLVRSFVVLGLASSVGFICNPNSLVFSFPVAVYVLLENRSRPSFYCITALSCVPALVFHLCAKGFYLDHRLFNVHSNFGLNYSMELLMGAFGRLDRFLGHLMPIAWSMGWLVLPTLLLIVVKLRRRAPHRAIALMSALILMIVILGVDKVNDDAGTLFLSSVRMFLGAPLLLALALFWWSEAFPLAGRQGKIVALYLAVCVFLVKVAVQNPIIAAHTSISRSAPVSVMKMNELRSTCEQLAVLVATHDVDLLVFVPDGDLTVPRMGTLAYACPLLEPGLPNTMLNVYERRTWVFVGEQERTRQNILIYGRTLAPEVLDRLACLRVVQLNEHMVLVSTEGYSVKQVLTHLGVDLKRNTY